MPKSVPTFHILLGCSGNVASSKVPAIINSLYNEALSRALLIEVKLIATEHALHHFSQIDPTLLSRRIPVHLNQQDKSAWKSGNDDALHKKLGKWADVFLIAPLSANSLAKFAGGQKDTLMTYVMDGWDPHKPCVVAPAMESEMYRHPLTRSLLDDLKKRHIYVVEPASKRSQDGNDGGYSASNGSHPYMYSSSLCA